ncbi:PEP-CTERM sorting domain-containing protein [Haloferula rosea]|uniref:PEP-CTERM sorting domain-containing protein n=1 Tax=Haloferula rosea TaxID=490093 RepID=A0A934VDS8_9BACT|nr:PEP-CTERM sorting domain-containing protein [Haloferula rosea]MBK1826579.1 PEP-CTERM sorting domain-containing protein [Haloferula rosea]
MKKKTRTLTASTLLGLLATSAQAVVVNTSNLTSYTVSNTDLLQTSLASYTGDDFLQSGGQTTFLNALASEGITVGSASLSDGVWYDHDPSVYAAGGGNFNDTLDNANTESRGSAVTTPDTFGQWNLDLAASPLGYDITQIDLYSNWGDGSGRDDIRVTISMSLVGTPTVFDQVVVTNQFIEFETANTQGAMNITGDGGGLIGTGIAAIRFDFPAIQEANGVGYSELDVIGTATIPEPSTALLGGLGGFLLLRRRRA